jgi:hypothetical protein
MKLDIRIQTPKDKNSSSCWRVLIDGEPFGEPRYRADTIVNDAYVIANNHRLKADSIGLALRNELIARRDRLNELIGQDEIL